MSARANVRRDDGVRALEEVVDDLDLLRPGPEARERVDEPLQPVVRLDDLLGRPLARASSSCSRARAPASPSRCRTSSRPCRRTPSCSNANGRSGRAPASAAIRRASSEPQYDATKPAMRSSSSSVTAGYQARTCSTSGARRRLQVDELEQAVHRVADLGRRQPALPGDRAVRVRRPHAGDALGVVAVGAALEERERAVGEPAHVVQRRLRQRLDRREHRRERRQRRRLAGREERELAGLRLDRLRLGLGRRAAPAPAAASGRAGRARARPRARARSARRRRSSSSAAQSSRSSTQPIGVFSSALRAWSIEPETISRSIARVIAT